MDAQQIIHNFTYHQPKQEQIEKYNSIRRWGQHFSEAAIKLTPNSREQTIGLRKIEEATFWLNAAIARHEGEE